jgi:ATP-binding cassette subfamily F protein 3
VAITKQESIVKKNERPRQRKIDQDKSLKNQQKLEGEIAMLELEIKTLEYRLNDPASHEDQEASQQLADEYSKAQKALAEKYDAWVELTEE